MPRVGVTDEQMAAAVAALQARGETVSKITVRKELGETGSYSTISAFLSKWREAQQAVDPTVPGIPIPERVQAAYAMSWNLAVADAQAELAKDREALIAEMEAKEKANDLALAEAEEATRTLEVQLEDKTAQVADLIAKDEAVQALVVSQAEQIGYLKGKLEDALKAKEAAEKRTQEAEVLTENARQKAEAFEARIRELDTKH